MAELTIQVRSCLGCPRKSVDANVTRYICTAAQQTIGWLSEVEDAVEAGVFTFPEWCPLFGSAGATATKTKTNQNQSPVRPVYSLDEV